MKKTTLPIVLIVASVILIIANIIDSEVYNRAFWMQIVSSVLLIFAMILTIRSMKKQE